MSVYVVDASVLVGRVLELIARAPDDEHTVVCVSRSRVLGWVRSAQLRRSVTLEEPLANAELQPTALRYDSDAEATLLEAGDVTLRIDWVAARTALETGSEPIAADDGSEIDRSRFAFERGANTGRLTWSPSPGDTAVALLAGLSVLPPGTAPRTVETCRVCGDMEIITPPGPPPERCRQPDTCRLVPRI